MKIHVGCGVRDFGRDWVHVDGRSFGHVDHVLKDEQLGFLPSICGRGEATMIYAAHVLSYFDLQEGKLICGHWRDKLRSGGVLRLSVPDITAIMDLYLSEQDEDVPFQWLVDHLFGRMNIGSRVVYHRCSYDERGLREILISAGFDARKIGPWQWPEAMREKYKDCSQVEYFGKPISLNLEAEK